jgi:hypothetical protein
MSNELNPVCRDWSDHNFKDEYYGHRCEHCDLFYPYGGAPWDPFCNRCHAMFEEECACGRSDEFDED